MNSRHFVVWKRKKNDVSALGGSGCVQNFQTAAPGTDARFASRIEADNHVNPAVTENESMCSTLRAEPITAHVFPFSQLRSACLSV